MKTAQLKDVICFTIGLKEIGFDQENALVVLSQKDYEKMKQLQHYTPRKTKTGIFVTLIPCTSQKKRKFEHLDAYLGLGCFPSEQNNCASLITSDLFCHAAAKQTIQNNSKGEMDVVRDCVAYLFECCYDLMLSTASNVSVNPGFERFTGQH